MNGLNQRFIKLWSESEMAAEDANREVKCAHEYSKIAVYVKMCTEGFGPDQIKEKICFLIKKLKLKLSLRIVVDF